MRVELTAEHLLRMRKSASTGLLELVKNGLDAAAELVTVEFDRSPVGAVERVTVTDDGVGMSESEVREFFRPLSRSWKRTGVPWPHRGQSSAGHVPARQLFGRKGEGRLTAFAIGSRTEWTSTWLEDDELRTQRVEWADTDLEGFRRTSIADTAAERTGTTVSITGVHPAAERLTSTKVRKLLEEKLGVYLEKYQSVSVVLDGRPLSMGNVQVRRTPLEVPVPAETAASSRFADASPAAVLEVVEWSIPTTAAVWLAGPDGPPVAEVSVHELHSGVSFTAWLRWDGWASMDTDVTMATVAADSSALVDAAGVVLSEYLRARSATRATELLAEWKDEGSYPYDGTPTGPAEIAERELFDIVAVTAAPALEQSDRVGRSFALRLLSEAVRSDQTELGRILREVFELDEATQGKLLRLLDGASLTTIVELSHTVLQRAKFLDWLKTLIYDRHWSKAVGETPGLHDLLAPNTWVFGDKWSFMASEIGLTKFAREHEAQLVTDLADPTAYDDDAEQMLGALGENDELVDATGTRRRLDLLLVQAGGPSDEPHYLVVELKRPSRRLTQKDLSQIENYLDTLGTSAQFANAKVRWTFVLVGRDCVGPVERKRTQKDRPVGLVSDGEFPAGSQYELWVRTWTEVLSEAGQRLDFVREALEAAPSTAEDFEFLHSLHREVLPPLDLRDPRDPVGVV